jgi:hypothetical protein
MPDKRRLNALHTRCRGAANQVLPELDDAEAGQRNCSLSAPLQAYLLLTPSRAYFGLTC